LTIYLDEEVVGSFGSNKPKRSEVLLNVKSLPNMPAGEVAQEDLIRA
jgi:hypothetical protein